MKGVLDYYVGVNGIGASCSKKTNSSEFPCKNLDAGSFSVNLKEQIKFIKECSEGKAMVRDNKAPKLMNIMNTTTISENAKKKDNGNDGYGDSSSSDDEDAGAGIGHTNGCKPRTASKK